MADSKVQRQAEVWIRETWLPAKYERPFIKGKLPLAPGGQFEFDGISDDGSIAVAISTNGGLTTGGRKASSKLHKLRADVLFLMMARVARRVLVLADRRMYEIAIDEKQKGRLPHEIEIEHAELPSDMRAALLAAQLEASDEMATVKVVGPSTSGSTRRIPAN